MAERQALFLAQLGPRKTTCQSSQILIAASTLLLEDSFVFVVVHCVHVTFRDLWPRPPGILGTLARPEGSGDLSVAAETKPTADSQQQNG